MDPVLIAVFAGAGMISAAVGGMLASGRARRKREERRQLEGWLEERQLQAHDIDSWAGEHDERALHVRLSFDRIKLSLRFWPELGLGLNIQGLSKGALERFRLERHNKGRPHAEPQAFALTGKGALHLGKTIRASAHEVAQLKQLLSAEVKKELHRTVAASDSIAINDAQLIMRLPRSATPEMLNKALRRASVLMAEMDKAREQVKPSAALQPLLPHWQRVAEDNELTLRHIPLSLSGMVGQRHAVASTTRTHKGEWSLDITVWFEQSLGEPFELRPVAGDHDSFEAAFANTSASACVAQLEDDVRKKMLEMLRQHGALTLNARYLWLRCHQLPEPKRIAPLLQEMSALSRDIEDCVQAPALVTGYRGPTRQLPQS